MGHVTDEETPAHIPGFRIRGFRTLVDVEAPTTGSINVVCGPNNSGKSSFLRSLGAYSELLAWLKQQRSSKADVPEPVLQDIEDGLVGIPLHFRSEAFRSLIYDRTGRTGEVRDEILEEMTSSIEQGVGGSYIWLDFAITNGKPAFIPESLTTLERLHTTARQDRKRQKLAGVIAGVGGAGSLQGPSEKVVWVSNVISKCFPIPRIRSIVDIRRSSQDPLSKDDLWRLVKDSSYDTVGSRLEEWTSRLEQVLQDVFGPGVTYAANPIDNQAGELTLSLDGQVNIPVGQVGAGVREVIAIGYRALAGGGADVICIEEPENCLHPTAVRRLITSLARRANVQVFVSTHSAAVINSAPDTVIEMTRSGAQSSGRTLTNAGEHFRAIVAMGHSPADLVLTPCAVWVEGPTDAMYLTEWLEVAGLRRGIDYHIGIYGGILGSHISASQEDAAEFLSEVRPISRRCVLVADSDRRKERGPLQPHVTRWRSEVKDDPDAKVIVTWGRSIENSLPLEVINDLRRRAGHSKMSAETLQYGDIFRGYKTKRKVAFAERALKQLVGTIPEHAEKMTKELARFIQKSRVV